MSHLTIESLDQYRPYLELLVRQQQEVDTGLMGKLDLSGIVQQTLMEAHDAFPGFRGYSREQVCAWLRQILAHNMCDEVRRLTAQVRDVRRERSLESRLDESHDRAMDWLAAEQTSPSGQAERAELLLRLSAALAMLPKDQRTAIELHFLQGETLAKTAVIMNRSQPSVASLVFRGIRSIRREMHAEDSTANGN